MDIGSTSSYPLSGIDDPHTRNLLGKGIEDPQIPNLLDSGIEDPHTPNPLGSGIEDQHIPHLFVTEVYCWYCVNCLTATQQSHIGKNHLKMYKGQH